jgi:hypothetical protein
MTKYSGPAYGEYGVYTNPFGTGFYHGYVSGLYASRKAVMERYPDITDSQIELYLNGRDDGVRRSTLPMSFKIFRALTVMRNRATIDPPTALLPLLAPQHLSELR